FSKSRSPEPTSRTQLRTGTWGRSAEPAGFPVYRSCGCRSEELLDCSATLADEGPALDRAVRGWKRFADCQRQMGIEAGSAEPGEAESKHFELCHLFFNRGRWRRVPLGTSYDKLSPSRAGTARMGSGSSQTSSI